MTDKETVLELIYRALLDIRIASYSQDSRTSFILSDIFHNVPSQINQADKGKMSYADIISYIQKKCEEKKSKSWFDNAMADITKRP